MRGRPRLCRQRVKAIALQSEDVHLRYMKYLNGCAELFRDGYTDVHQFTLRKTGSDA
jgi:cyclopropane-fatty-acyl-phospholipid synthase